MNRENEIDRFKREINLSEYAASEGYEIDRTESTRSSVVMRGLGDDKLIITLNSGNKHWIYFSVRADDDNGTIIDFVQKRKKLDLGQTRKILRPWIGEHANPPKRHTNNSFAKQVTPVSKNIARVIVDFSAMQPINGYHRYLVEERCIPVAVLSNPRFSQKIRTDGRHNAIFPHFNTSGLCGYEIKNFNYTGFSRGGQKGVGASSISASDKTLIVTESLIDAMSYHALFQPAEARYISTGGSLGPEQPKLLQAAIRKLPENGTLTIATDKDQAGDDLLESIKRNAQIADRVDVKVVEHRPSQFNCDWNDVLRAQFSKKAT